MKKKLKGLFYVILMVSVLLGVLPNDMVLAAGRTPNDDWLHPYIEVYTNEKDSVYIYSKESIFKAGKLKGITYDKKKKTITISNYKNANANLVINSMGKIKIKIVGKNELKTIRTKGHKTGSIVTITGTGTLEVNKNRKAYVAINVDGEEEKASLTVDKKVTLKAYAGESASVIVDTTSVDDEKKAVVLKSGKSVKNIDKKEFYHVERLPYWVHMTYEDGTDEWLAASVWVAHKEDAEEDDDTKYVAYQVPNVGWCIFKDIDVIFNGYPEAELFSRGEDKRFSFQAYGYQYGYGIKEDFIIKGKK